MMRCLDELKAKLRTFFDGPCALMRWNYGTNRVADHFVPLSDVRLTCAVLDKEGQFRLSVSAPYAKRLLGRIRVWMADNNLVLITEGSRKGVNCRRADVKANEAFTSLSTVFSRSEGQLLLSDEAKISSLVKSKVKYPVDDICFPQFYVLTKNPKKLCPLWTRYLETITGVDPFADDNETRKMKFVDNIHKFSVSTDNGYLINPEHVASGGMLCVSRLGAARQTGGPVYVVPLKKFNDYTQGHGWSLFQKEEIQC